MMINFLTTMLFLSTAAATTAPVVTETDVTTHDSYTSAVSKHGLPNTVSKQISIPSFEIDLTSIGPISSSTITPVQSYTDKRDDLSFQIIAYPENVTLDAIISPDSSEDEKRMSGPSAKNLEGRHVEPLSSDVEVSLSYEFQMMFKRGKTMQSILKRMDDTVDGKTASVKTILNAFGDRAFGPVLALCGFLMVTPIGAIPGVPAVICVIIVSFSVQLLLGRSRPWLPKSLNKISVSQKHVDLARDYAEPTFKKLDSVVQPRMTWAATKMARVSAAFVSIFLALILLLLAPLPFGGLIPGMLIALLGLGVMARDGLVISVSFILTIALIVSALIFAT